MNRDKSRVMWQRVAGGELTEEMIAWLVQTANRLLEADRLKDANKRRLGIVEAVGLAGRTGADVTAAVKVVAELDPSTLGATPRQQRAAKEKLMAMMLGVRVGPKGIDRENLQDRVRRRLKK